ncbi:peptidoglycan DD-metalloendopeptidase family protein [Campylobacter sp. CX2-8023-23]|uniref:Peptidoglycan DD-metalloendopeptidase family protein n=1 Tax=Campylobacter porcelli TaxID=1660073 RepID=A0ABU7M503_9BACT|nr:peptidoglycan DD-metalloendopeptidase family protein [Campylobacter sp. CX2-8023-23]MEE3744782.1 peptidoglycan DD-metalloendopeptidase family protein [Campylobacter sp. CX2-4855-23]MEE3777106.1 peptidoglycan DD-metalloendopeptidase family protein [Campylobacter sp. CX2-4080-23]
MKKFILSILAFMNLNAVNVSVEELIWPQGDTFLTFLERHNIPLSIYYNLSGEDKELASELSAGTKFQILRDINDEISQILLPISNEIQIHIFKDINNHYSLDFIPIVYEIEEMILNVQIQDSPYKEIKKATNDEILANAFNKSFNGSVNFKTLQKGDRLAIIYERKKRLGKYIGEPNIKVAMVETRGKQNYIYKFNDVFYNADGKEIENFLLTRPVPNARISSRFNPKRFHPVLKRYRAHLGVDYAAPRGTKIYAAGDGVVSFVGNKGGYGKTVTIDHSNGYMTLYAHVNGYAKGIKKGKKVKKGQLIAYVGSTGLSTGPHLHFGLYKNGNAINPESVVRIAKSELKKEQKIEFNKLKESLDNQIQASFENHINKAPLEDIANITEI